MAIELNIALQPKQLQLLNAIRDRRPEAPTVLGFGGSRGAAKSGGVRRIALVLATETPHCIVWIIRRVWDDLNKDHVKPLFLEYPILAGFWHAGDKELRLPNGSSIFFIHAGDTGRAKRKARGPQAHYIFLEQAEEFSGEEIQQLDGSNRAPGAVPGFCKKILTFNPGGIGTNYLRRVMWLRQFRDNEDPAQFMFIQAYGWDNYEWFRGLGTISEWDFYHSPEWDDARRFRVFTEQTDFGRKLNALPQSQRIGELMGSFEQFAGQYYADVWEQSSCVLSVDTCLRMIRPWWRRWLATDWGYSHYAATGWFTSGLLSPEDMRGLFGIESVAPVRVVVIYRELVCNDVPEPTLAQLICQMTPEAERREVRYHFMGHDAWAKRGSANTVVEQMDPVFRAAGLPPLDRADIDRVGGWRLLYNAWASARRLRNWPGGGPFEASETDTVAFFVSAACAEVISAVPMLITDYDPTGRPNGNPQDVRKMAGQVHDDVADMVRYGVKSFVAAEPAAPAEVVRVETYQRYDGNTAEAKTRQAMAMLQLTARQQKEQALIRRARG